MTGRMCWEEVGLTSLNPLKFDRLKSVISGYESVLVAFSGGIDSAFVLKVARDTLGFEKAKAVTAKSPSLAARELEEARAFAETFRIEHKIIETEEFENPHYTSNPSDRCYYCKEELYAKLIPMARAWNLKTVASGTQLDDLGDIRPGLRAAEEYGVKNPLVEAGFTKQDVREWARHAGIELWSKPASPCLSSRVPHGEAITLEKLAQIEAGENFLKDLGFKIIRLRHLGHKARVELGTEEFVALMEAGLRERATDFIRSLGFKVVVFEPYRQGRLNEQTVH